MIALPERGRIGIFNRSYYEECLVVRVHPEILAKQKIPPQLVTKDIWRDRFEDISAMERYLARNGTVILKFFLNVSKEEQRERFLERLEEPAKNWKFSLADIARAQAVGEIQAAYQDLIRHTSTRACALARRAGRPQMVRARGDRLGHRQRARQARPAFPEGRQGRPQRIQAGARGAAGGGEGDEEVGWVERSETHSILFDGAEIAGVAPHRIINSGIGRTFQIPRPFHRLSIFENVALAGYYGQGSHSRAKADEAAERALHMVGLPTDRMPASMVSAPPA